jgi:cytochrome c biogenesis protein CcmG, thiol:disulfide interchange protein DsbE
MVGSGRAPSVRLVVAAALLILPAACGSAKPRPGCGGATDLLPASPTALPTLDARGFRDLLCQLRGKPVVVNVWASWCGPCIFEAPDLASAAKEYAGQVQFVGVDVQDQLAPGRAFIEKYGWTYPSVFDPSAAIRDSFGLVGAPHTIFFDAQGGRSFVWSGPVTKEVLANAIKGALRRLGTSPSASPTSPIPSG